MSSFKKLTLQLKPYYYAPFVYWTVEGNKSWLFSPSEIVQVRFQAEKQGTITHLGFYPNGYFGGEATRLMRVSIQKLDATGRPDGIPRSYCNFRPSDFTGNGSNFQWLELVSSYSVQRGEMLALVISSMEWNDNASAYSTNILSVGNNFPTSGGLQPVFGYRYGDGEACGLPIDTTHFYDGLNPFNFPKQHGLRFVLDSGWGDTFRVAGIRWQGYMPSGSYSYDLYLYQGDKALQSVKMYGDQGVGTYNYCVNEIYFNEEPLIDLTFGTAYVIALEPQDANSGMTLDSMVATSAADLTAYPGGQDFFWAERPSSSDSWTYDTARRPLIDLIIDYWGKPAAPESGLHVKVAPKYNSSLFVEHADDTIHDVEADEFTVGESHEVARTIIGNTVKAYGGFKTVEVFKNPDTDCSIETRLFGEQLIEKLKIIGWDGMSAGLYHLVFRFRTEWESDYYVDFDQWMRIVN